VEDAVRFVNVFAAALTAGAWAVVMLIIMPARRLLSDGAAVRFHQVTTPLFDRYLAPVPIVAAVFGLLALVIDSDVTSVAGLATIAGLICTAGAGIVYVRFNRPANRMIDGWSADAVPPEYPEVRERWESAHRIRTLLGALALGLFLAAAIAS